MPFIAFFLCAFLTRLFADGHAAAALDKEPSRRGVAQQLGPAQGETSVLCCVVCVVTKLRTFARKSCTQRWQCPGPRKPWRCLLCNVAALKITHFAVHLLLVVGCSTLFFYDADSAAAAAAVVVVVVVRLRRRCSLVRDPFEPIEKLLFFANDQVSQKKIGFGSGATGRRGDAKAHPQAALQSAGAAGTRHHGAVVDGAQDAAATRERAVDGQ